jgi:hypothetical protein
VVTAYILERKEYSVAKHIADKYPISSKYTLIYFYFFNGRNRVIYEEYCSLLSLRC